MGDESNTQLVLGTRRRRVARVQRTICSLHVKGNIQHSLMSNSLQVMVVDGPLQSIFFWHYPLNIYTRFPVGPSWSWSYGSWICNYLCNQWLSSLMLCVQIVLMARCTRYKIMISLFSSGIPASSTNKTDSHYKTEILLKVVLNTIAKLLTPTLVVAILAFVHMPIPVHQRPCDRVVRRTSSKLFTSKYSPHYTSLSWINMFIPNILH